MKQSKKVGITVMNPVESRGFLINLSVLGIAIILEFTVLYKAGKEILHEVGIDKAGTCTHYNKFSPFKSCKTSDKTCIYGRPCSDNWWSFRIHCSFSCTFSLVLLIAEGIASMLIGLMMFYVVGKVFLENARGAIGETDEEMLNHIAHIIAQDPDVKDIQRVEVIKGRGIPSC